MGVDVLLEVIDVGLLVVAQVADAECPSGAELPVECEHLTEVGGTHEGGGHDIPVVVTSCKDLVVRLPVIRTEHNSQQGEVQLVGSRSTTARN